MADWRSQDIPRSEFPFWASGSRRVSCLANIMAHYDHSRQSTTIDYTACLRRTPGAMPHVDKHPASAEFNDLWISISVRGYHPWLSWRTSTMISLLSTHLSASQSKMDSCWSDVRAEFKLKGDDIRFRTRRDTIFSSATSVLASATRCRNQKPLSMNYPTQLILKLTRHPQGFEDLLSSSNGSDRHNSWIRNHRFPMKKLLRVDAWTTTWSPQDRSRNRRPRFIHKLQTLAPSSSRGKVKLFDRYATWSLP
jgi:hypothetical protein